MAHRPRCAVCRMTDTAGSAHHLTSSPTSTPVDGWRFIPRTHLPARRRLTDCGVAPTSPHPVGAGFHARPALVDRQRWYAAPTLHQPLSHGAMRRDSSPFRGAERWADVCGVCASVYRDADTVVFLSPVRGGVLDAPRLRDRLASLDASVRPDQLSPCHPRRARLRPPPNE